MRTIRTVLPQTIISERPMVSCRFHRVEGVKAESIPGTLARVNYTNWTGRPQLIDQVPTLDLHMADAPDQAFTEIWSAGGPLSAGVRDGLVYAHDEDVLFCAGYIAESDAYAGRARSAYLSAFALLDSLGFRQIFRIWNFIHHINQANGAGLEIYRDFCRGRAEAFEQHPAWIHRMPAATGIGSLGGGIPFYFLACRAGRVIHLENPRQVPAYSYPRQYGPKSPSFARATYLTRPGWPASAGALYVAGTASILGHETVHAGDVGRQCDVALENIAHLISAANLSRHGIGCGYDLNDLRLIKVYTRHLSDIPLVERKCREAFSPEADIRFLNVDICRRDLLVEIEGVIQPEEDDA